MNQETAKKLLNDIQEAFSGFPYFGGYISHLDSNPSQGIERPSVMITVSLDPRESWKNGILENSRYAKVAFHNIEVDKVQIEHFSGHGMKKIRSAKVEGLTKIMRKVCLMRDAWKAEMQGTPLDNPER